MSSPHPREDGTELPRISSRLLPMMVAACLAGTAATAGMLFHKKGLNAELEQLRAEKEQRRAEINAIRLTLSEFAETLGDCDTDISDLDGLRIRTEKAIRELTKQKLLGDNNLAKWLPAMELCLELIEKTEKRDDSLMRISQTNLYNSLELCESVDPDQPPDKDSGSLSQEILASLPEIIGTVDKMESTRKLNARQKQAISKLRLTIESLQFCLEQRFKRPGSTPQKPLNYQQRNVPDEHKQYRPNAVLAQRILFHRKMMCL